MRKLFWNDNACMNDKLINKRDRKLIDYHAECMAVIMSFFYYGMVVFSIVSLSVVPVTTYIYVVSPCLNETIQANYPAAIVKNKSIDSTNNKNTFVAISNVSSTAHDTYDIGRSTSYDNDWFIISCISKSVYKDFWKLTFITIIYIAMLVTSYKMLIIMKSLVSKHRKYLRAIYMTESKSKEAPFRTRHVKIITKHSEKKMTFA